MAKRKQPTSKAGKLSPAVEPGQPGVREVTDVIELTNAIVKSKYEANANTNAFTDAEKTKLGTVETSATADQTDGEIEAAYNNQVAAVSQAEAEAGSVTGIRRWSPLRIAQAIAALAGGGGGGDSRSTINSTNNNMTLTGQYFGSSAPVLSGGGAGDYALTNGAAVDWLNIDGNNTSLNGSSELVITLAGTNRRFTWDVIAANTEQDQDEPALSLSIKQDRSGADMIITLGGLAGFGSAGFTVVLS